MTEPHGIKLTIAEMIEAAVRKERERIADLVQTDARVYEHPNDDQGRLAYRLDLADAIRGIFRELPHDTPPEKET